MPRKKDPNAPNKKAGRPKGTTKGKPKEKFPSKRQEKGGGLQITKEEREKIIEEITEFVLNGYGTYEIVRFINDNYGYNYSNSWNFIREAREYIAIRSKVDLEKLVYTHTHIYQEIIQYFQNTNNTKGMLVGMNRLEKLMGLHKEETNIEINNNTNVEIEQEAKYDFKKLSSDEENRLNDLMKKISDK